MNALNALVRPRTSYQGPHPDSQSRWRSHSHSQSRVAPPRAASARVRDADGMAVASFVLGLAGLLVFNVILGPCALVLAGLALARGTTRRARALLGLTLGAADLVVLAAVVTADQSFSWSITG